MRKLFLLILITLPVTSPVLAADLPTMKGPVYAPPPLFSWTGFYVGANVGYADANTSVSTQGTDAASQGQITAGTVPPGFFSGHGGVTAGGQAGFNYEFPTASQLSVVAGLEADFDYTDVRGSSLLNTAFNTTNFYSSSLNDLGTVRGRVGAAFDRALIYVTGGFAYGYSQYSHVFNSNQTPPVPIWGGGINGERTGFVVGAGVEYALNFPTMGSGAWTIRAEYLHYDLGTATATLPFLRGAGVGPLLDRDRLTGNIARVGLNYKFDLFGPPAPVVSKY